MGPIGLPELIVIFVMLAVFVGGAVGLVFLILFLLRRDREVQPGAVPFSPPPSLPSEKPLPPQDFENGASD